MIGSATITGKVGPATTVTALALSNVTSVVYDIVARTITFFYISALGAPKNLVVDMSDISAVTTTIVEGVSLTTVVTNA